MMVGVIQVYSKTERARKYNDRVGSSVRIADSTRARHVVPIEFIDKTLVGLEERKCERVTAQRRRQHT